MAKSKNVRRVARVPASTGVRKELRRILWVALPIGAVSVLVVLWPTLFPVPPQQLVEVVWTHECECVHGWIKSLRNQSLTVRDFEMDDLRTQRQRMGFPSNIQNCHPATYLGYFLDGHVSGSVLHRLARERPRVAGVRQLDAGVTQPADRPAVSGGQVMLVDENGNATAWD